MAFDSTERVYVADHGNNRIQVFTAEGEQFGKYGNVHDIRWVSLSTCEVKSLTSLLFLQLLLEFCNIMCALEPHAQIKFPVSSRIE